MSGDVLSSDQEIESLRSKLARNELIRKKLEDGGRIHIDRPQPFLCVYRYPSDRPDRGTDRLLLGGASYLLLREAGERPRRLIRALAAQLVETFGAVIVLEIWAAAPAPNSNTAPATGESQFRIVSPTSSSPMRTLETLERAVLAAGWPGGKPSLQIEYLEHTGPPAMQSLLGSDELNGTRITSLGLELAPIYRMDDENVYPEVLRRMRKELWHVLREAFYTFSHTRASYRPAHYHELGPRAMTKLVAETDRALATVSGSYDLLLHVTPVNTEEAWAKFQADGYRGTPEFHYRPLHVDPGELKRTLYTIPIDDIDDPALHNLFSMKRDEVDRQITMLCDRESPRFVLESLQIYGRAASELRQTAVSILERPFDPETSSSGALGADDFAAAAREELASYREQDSGFESQVIVSDTVPGLLVSNGTLFIGKHAAVDASRVAATLHHEVGTHVLTYYNGLAQPFQQLHAGLAGYEELQEGLAVFAEYLVGGLSPERMRVLAGRVIAVESVAEGAEFGETFAMLANEYGFERRTAYSITMRVHRAGGFSKDVIYLRGLTGLLSYLAGGGDHAELLVGKISLSQMEVIRELRWRRILEAPRLKPRYLDLPSCRERLQRARDGLGIGDLLAT